MHIEYEFDLDEMEYDLEYDDYVPQAQVIWQAIIAGCRRAGVNVATEDEVKKLMQYLVDEGILQTSQSPYRVFKYYRATYGQYTIERYEAEDVISTWDRIKMWFKARLG